MSIIASVVRRPHYLQVLQLYQHEARLLKHHANILKGLSDRVKKRLLLRSSTCVWRT